MIPTATEPVVANSEKEVFLQNCVMAMRPHRNNRKYCNCAYKQVTKSNKDIMSIAYFCSNKHPLY